jgi:DNA-binding LacI/PurR family transcriptional regulator
MATVRQPLHEMGRLAVEVLMQRIEALRDGEPADGPSNIVLPTGIVPGATLAAPRRRALVVG